MELSAILFILFVFCYILGVTSVEHTLDHSKCSNTSNEDDLFNTQAFYHGQALIERATGLKLGLLIIDSCGSSVIAWRSLNQLFSQNPAPLLDSSKLVHLVEWYQFSLVITDQSDTLVSAIYPILSALNIPIISTSSRSSWLSDSTRYPLLQSFKKSNQYETQALLEIVTHENIKAVVVVYSSNNYGESAKLHFMEQAKHYKVCIEQEITVHESPESIEDVGKKLGTNSILPRSFILLMDDATAEKLLKQLVLSDILWSTRGRIFIGGSGLTNSIPQLLNYGQLLAGSMFLSSNPGPLTKFSLPATDLADFFNSIVPANSTTDMNPHLMRLLSNASF